MTDWDPRTNGTLRGFLIIVAIAAAITAAGQAGAIGLGLVLLLLNIAFIVAICVFLFILWRRNRHEISLWPLRSRVIFYGAALLAIVDVAARFILPWPVGAFQALAFFVVLGACVFAMFRVWQDQHTYGY
jgi:hypothetical protein